MVDLVTQFLKNEGYDIDVLDSVLEETGVVKPPQSKLSEAETNVADNISKRIVAGEAVRFPDGQLMRLDYSDDLGESKEELAAQATKEYMRQLRQETGFGDTFTYYATEPLLGLAEELEAIGLPISFDEEKAQLFKDTAEVAAQNNPILGTTAMLGGAVTAFGTGLMTRLGRAGATGVRALGGGKTAQAIGEGTLAGGIYGGLIPDLERGTDTGTNILTGGLLGGATLGTLRAIPAALQRSAQRSAERVDSGGTFAPKPRASTPAGRAIQTTAEGIDNVLGVLSTRIGNISESVLGRMQRFEFDTKKLTSDLYDEVEPFVSGLQRLAPDTKNSVARGLYNGSFDAVENILKKEAPEMVDEFRKVQSTLERVRQDLVDAGFTELETGLANYFPRIVKDYEGLRSMLGANERTILDNALQARAKKLGVKVTELDPAIVSAEIARLIKQGKIYPAVSRPSSTKARQIDYVTDEMLPFYATPEESLEIYLRNAAHNINKGKLLGKIEPDDFDSISGYLTRLRDAGELTDAQVSDLIPLLQSRLIQGELSPRQFIRNLRDFGYATTIANPLSALIQLGDIAVSAVLNGLRNTIRAALGKKNILIDDIGLKDTIIQDIDRPGRTLDRLFRISAFKRIDKLGKETFINSAFTKYKNMVQSDAGAQAFRNKFGARYGDEVEQMIIDLRNGEVTDRVKFHLFNELSGVQPISLLEVPQAYLNNPNGRIFYALKSFTIKQLDILRRNIYNKARSNPKEAAQFALKYAAFISLANGTLQTIRDVLTGKITSTEEAVEQFPNQMLWETLNVMGFNEYVNKRYFKQGDIMQGIAATVAPPIPMVESFAKEIMQIGSDTQEFDVEPIVRTTPVVGPTVPLMATWYNFMFGGFEDYLSERDKSNER